MRRRIVALFLITAIGLTGCGGQKGAGEGNTQTPAAEDGSATQDAATADAVTTESGEDGEIDIWAPYEDTVTITTVKTENSGTTYPEGDDMSNNVWIRAYKDKFNVEVVTDWVSDEYDTKINLSIAEGNLPDIFSVNASQLEQLIEADLIWDMTDIFDTYASDRLKEYMAADEASYKSGMKDGKLYGIAQMHYGFIEQFDYVWIRKEWKEALNLPDPETMDDVIDICKAFMDEYGGYGMAVDQSLDHLNLLAPAWGAYPDLWYKDESGEIIYGSVQPAMKDALAAWAEWYKEGILNPDFVTVDYSKMNEDVVAGTVGVQPFYQWWGYDQGTNIVSNLGTEAYFEPYKIPSATGETVKQPVFCANNSYTVVSKKCQNPEAAIKLINYYAYMTDDSNGVEEPETIDAFLNNGIPHSCGAFRVLNPNADYDDYVRIAEAMKTGDTSVLTTAVSKLKYDGCIEYEEKGTSNFVGYCLQVGYDRCAYAIGKEILDNNEYILSALWGQSPDTLLNAGSTLDDILTEGFTKIIIGQEPVDYFDTIVQNWMTAGGESAIQEMNEMYGD